MIVESTFLLLHLLNLFNDPIYYTNQIHLMTQKAKCHIYFWMK